MSTLIAHNGTEIVHPEVLRSLPNPRPQGPRHKPIPHWELREEVLFQLRKRGILLARRADGTPAETWAVGNARTRTSNGDRSAASKPAVPYASVFAMLELQGDFLPGTHYSIGIRGDNAKKVSLQMIAGATVFVCDNWAFNGDHVLLARKHTTGLDLAGEIGTALMALSDHKVELKLWAREAMREFPADGDSARACVFRLFEGDYHVNEGLPPRMLPSVWNTFEVGVDTAAHEDITYSPWGVYNAVTRVLRERPVNVRMKYAQVAQRVLRGVTG